ncbi:IS3 family transposase [Culicoidibacter larvae]
MKSFFASIKDEIFYEHEEQFKSICGLISAIIEYISYYSKNRSSPHTLFLGKSTEPVMRTIPKIIPIVAIK